MTSNRASTQRTGKPGTSRDAAALRHKLFVDAYLTNGNNATQAAISAGYSAKTAKSAGARLLTIVDVSQRVAAVAEKVAFDSGLSVERWAKEIACIAHFDPRELYDTAGNLIPIHQLPEHVRRAISLEIPLADGTKIKPRSKEGALADIAKHLGMFERDNRQKREDIKVTIQLVG